MSKVFNDLDKALRDKVFLEKGGFININYRLTPQKNYSSFTDRQRLSIRFLF